MPTLECDGFEIVPNVLCPERCDEMLAYLRKTLKTTRGRIEAGELDEMYIPTVTHSKECPLFDGNCLVAAG